MLKKKTFWLMAFSFLWLPCSASCDDAIQKHPALALMSFYADEIKNKKTINPYVANIIAIYELNRFSHIEEVKKYIKWYFKRLNYPDRHGLTGTIYDYEISANGEEISINDYDSVDGYAGTFLYLLNLYHLRTGDNTLIKDHWAKIKDIAFLIPYLQGQDGLIIALPQDKEHTKYLMDNCEAYAGMIAFKEMARRTDHDKDWLYAEVAEKIKRGIMVILYDQINNNFYWAIDNQIKHSSNWAILYPDALAQTFPILFGLLDKDVRKKNRLWQEFKKLYDIQSPKLPLEQRMIYELTREKMRR